MRIATIAAIAVASSGIDCRSAQERPEHVVDLRPFEEPDGSTTFLLRRETTWDGPTDEWAPGPVSGWLPVQALAGVLRRSVPEEALSLRGDQDELRWSAEPDHEAVIAALLELLLADLTADPPLELHVWSGIATERVRTVPLEHSDRAEEEWASSGELERLRVVSPSVVSGELTHDRDQTTQPRILDYEIEISHAAVVYDPVTTTYGRGVRAAIRGARAPGGLRLDLAVAIAEAAREDMTRELHPKVFMASSIPHEFNLAKAKMPFAEFSKKHDLRPFVHHDTVPLRLDAPLDRVASFTTSTFLADGTALWIPITARGVEGDARFTLVVRPTGPAAPWMQVLPPTHDGFERVLVHAAAERPGGFERHFLGYHRDLGDDAGPQHFEPFHPYFAREFRTEYSSDSVEFFEELLEEHTKEDTYAVDSLGNDTLVLEAPLAKEGERLVDLVRRVLPAQRTAAIRAIVRDQDRVVADTELPMIVGLPATLRAGIEGRRLVDWDVDVANDAACANPDVYLYLDGTALELRITSVSEDRCEVEVFGLVRSLMAPPEPVALGSPYSPHFDGLVSHRKEIGDVLVVPLEAGVGTATVGGWPISLEITVSLGDSPAERNESSRGSDAAGAAEEEQEEEAGEIDEGLQHSAWEVDRYDLLGWNDSPSSFGASSTEPVTTPPLADPRRIEVRLLRARLDRVQARFLPHDVADQRIAALGKNALTHLTTAPLRAGADSLTEALDTRWAAPDFEVEIAHGAVIYDPVVTELTNGLSAILAPEGDDGESVRLRWVLRSLEDARPRIIRVEPRPVMGSPFPHAPIVVNGPVPLLLDALATQAFAVSGSVRIPDGMACWIPCQIHTVTGATDACFDVRIVGERPAKQAVDSTLRMDERVDEDESTWGELGGFSFPYVFQRSEADQEPDPAASTYRVNVRFPRDRDQSVQLSTFVLEGEAAFLVGGAVFHTLRDWDVDVAGEAIIGNPEPVRQFDGVFLRIAITENQEDRTQCLAQVQGEVRSPLAPPELVSIDYPITPAVERMPVFAREIDRRFPVKLDESGSATIRIPGFRQFEVEVHRLPDGP